MNAFFILGPIAAFLLAYIWIPILRKMAIQIQLVDKPNQRKVHQTPIPLVGGLSIFIATSITFLLAIPFNMDVFRIFPFFLATMLLLLLGIFDDRFDLRASFKLATQLILAHFVYDQGVKIESLHGLMGIYTLSTGAQYVLTIIVIAGVVNAFNLMDGIDGLAAGIAIIGLFIFSILAIKTGQTMLTSLFLTIIGALLAFLRFNLSQKQKIFMGDAGSIVLGFILVVAGIRILQASQNSADPALVTLGVISVLFVPVLDALRVFRKRAKAGKSPFSADKTHLHHLILGLGFKHKRATLAILILITSIMALGFIGFNLLGITFSTVAMLLGFYFVTSVLQFHNKLEYWKKRIFSMDHKR